MPDEKATRSRSYTVPMSSTLSAEIRAVAASMGLPASTVREIVSAPHRAQLAEWEGNVRHFVGLYFANVADVNKADTE